MNKICAGVDISAHNREVDFKQLKSGKIKGLQIKFVMIRLSVNKSVDAKAIKNIYSALEAGLEVGVYHYSYAKNPAEAKAEAELVLKTIKDNKLDGKLSLPIAFDIEENEVFALGKEKCTAICKAFMDTISAANYQPMLYTFAAAYNTFLNKEELKSYSLWIAGFISENTLNNKFGIKNYSIWQFSVAGNPNYDIEVIGSVSGVKGQCDCNYLCEDLPAKIKAEGKNGFSPENKQKSFSVTVGNIPSKILAEELLTYAKSKGLSGILSEEAPKNPEKPLKSIDEIAREVIQGKWGNGSERKERIEAAGYDFAAVQKRVNELF